MKTDGKQPLVPAHQRGAGRPATPRKATTAIDSIRESRAKRPSNPTVDRKWSTDHHGRGPDRRRDTAHP